MYESPIELIYKDVQDRLDNGILYAIQEVGIKVNKEELIKALEYDRKQYEKGYEDGKKEGRKIGRWIDDHRGLYRCSSCGEFWSHWWASCVSMKQMCKVLKYCPNCGADMEGETDE